MRAGLPGKGMRIMEKKDAKKKAKGCPIGICDNHTGKMEGIKSISTAVALNPFCQRNQRIPGSVCAHCFSQAMMGMYPALDAKLRKNSELLSSRVLDWDELPDLTGEETFRFESFGDLINETHLRNYLNIALKNPGTRFALWTKRYKLVGDWFSDPDPSHAMPPNMTLVISSMALNVPMPLGFLMKTGRFAPGQLKSFTVYEAATVEADWKGIEINCGSRFCRGCGLCYHAENGVTEIREVLKKEQPELERFLDSHDPKRVEARMRVLSELDDLDSLDSLAM